MIPQHNTRSVNRSCVSNFIPVIGLMSCLLVAMAGCSNSKDFSIHVPTSTGTALLSVGMTQAELKSMLGEPDLILGSTFNYQTLGISVTFSDDKNVSGIFVGHTSNEEYAQNFKGKTESGIMIGDADSNITENYGSPDNPVIDEKNLKAYYGEGSHSLPPDFTSILNYDRLGYKFTLRNGRLVHIVLRSALK